MTNRNGDIVEVAGGVGVGVENVNLNARIERRQSKLLSISPETHPISIGISAAADKLAGFLVAFVGGAFLLAPMCELTYVHSQKYQVISVVLWVLFFSMAVAATSRAKNQELLAATAVYAAVLVVFISRN
jgi:VIT1/CCC1 family predicted Fe2+/Mn2+ transporter